MNTFGALMQAQHPEFDRRCAWLDDPPLKIQGRILPMFWQLFKQSVLLQAFIAGTVVVTICVMYVQGKPVPVELVSMVMLVLGYFFGAKTQYSRAMDDEVVASLKRQAKEQDPPCAPSA